MHKNLAGYTTMVFPGRRRFVINAYSMGAWATGTNTGIAMARIAMVKNTGPDLAKIVDTLRHFGPGFDYVVTAYPPFLKHLRDRLDAEGFPWPEYRISGLVGGEAMTEALRDYLEERFREGPLGLRRERPHHRHGGRDRLHACGCAGGCAPIPHCARPCSGQDEHRLPMVFQYNPLETYLETTADGELLCTINSTAVLTPKLRYNVGDEGRLHSVPRGAGRDPGVRAAPRRSRPGRRTGCGCRCCSCSAARDSTISYMGANIYPQDVEYGLYTGNPLAHLVESFCLELERARRTWSRRPVVNLQLREGDGARRRASATRSSERCRRGVLHHLAAVSRDFAESLDEDPSAGDLRVRVHDFGTGPFAGTDTRIKNVYLVEGGRA